MSETNPTEETRAPRELPALPIISFPEESDSVNASTDDSKLRTERVKSTAQRSDRINSIFTGDIPLETPIISELSPEEALTVSRSTSQIIDSPFHNANSFTYNRLQPSPFTDEYAFTYNRQAGEVVPPNTETPSATDSVNEQTPTEIITEKNIVNITNITNAVHSNMSGVDPNNPSPVWPQDDQIFGAPQQYYDPQQQYDYNQRQYVDSTGQYQYTDGQYAQQQQPYYNDQQCNQQYTDQQQGYYNSQQGQQPQDVIPRQEFYNAQPNTQQPTPFAQPAYNDNQYIPPQNQYTAHPMPIQQTPQNQYAPPKILSDCGDVNPFSDFGDIGLDSFSAGSWASGTTNVSSLASYTSSVTDDSSVRKSSQFVFWTNIE